MSLRVFLAGRVAVEVDGRLIDEDRFAGRQGRLVFACLVMAHDRAVPHEELAEAIWGESPPATWRKALTVIVSKVRALLVACEIDGSNVLTSAFGCYRLQLPPGSWVDVLEAIESVKEAEKALAAGELEAATHVAQRAASLTRPQFLPGEEGAWVDAKRRELSDVLCRALACLAEASLLSGRSSEAAQWTEEAIALEPFRETGYRRLMEAHAAAGNRAEALRVYERCRLLLAQELGAYPSPETESIYRRLLGGPAPVSVLDQEPPPPAGSPEQAATALNGVVVAERPKRRRIRLFAFFAAAGAAAALIAVIAIGFADKASPPLARVQDNAVGIVDPQSREIVDEAAGVASPQRVAAGEGSVWVTSSSGGGTVVRLDPRSHDITDTIQVGNGPVGIAVGAGAVWVANSLDGTVSRIDPATGREVDVIEVGNTPTGVAFGAGAVWVTNADDGSVSRIDPLAGARARPQTIEVDAAARWIAVGGGAVWVTDPVGNALVRVDVRLRKVTARIAVGSGPTAVAYDDGTVWVANSLDGTVWRIAARRGVVTEVTAVGAAPNGIAVAADGVWVTTEVGGTLVRLDRTSRETAVTTLGGRPEGVILADGSLWIAVQAAGASHRGGTLRMVGDIRDIDSIDPALAYTPQAGQLLSEVYDGLVGYKRVGGTDGNTLVPNLASALPAPTDNGKTYTFHLHRGIRFADGSELKASTVLYSLERLFRAHTPPPIERSAFLSYFEGIVGGPACSKQPRRCDLSKGVVTDDVTGTVTIRLRAPDPDFLHKLTFAWVVPTGTPDVAVMPIPGTGPYRIAEYNPNRSLRLVRNRHFKLWSNAAKPQGLPDQIVLTDTSGDEGVTAVQRGTADQASVPPDRLKEVRIRYASQLHVTPRAGTYFLLLNTKRPPFDDPRARQAVAYAVDRGRLVEGFGGGEGAAPTCQVLPPNFPGYNPYCPHTARPTKGFAWTAPDLKRARRLVAESGTKGMRVDVAGLAESGGFTTMTTVLDETLRRLGYRTSTKWLPFEEFLDAFDDVARVEASQIGWFLDYAAPSGFITPLLSCTSNPYACNDPTVDRMLRGARALQARNQTAANEAWAQLDRYVVDQAIVIPVITPNATTFVSKRLGNYQRHPIYGMLLGQAWVRE